MALGWATRLGSEVGVGAQETTLSLPLVQNGEAKLETLRRLSASEYIA